jgi:hypothetical protein
MFGRKSSEAQAQPSAQAESASGNEYDPQAPKGRPTPSRKEAEQARKSTIRAPKGTKRTKEGKKAARDRDREDRARSRAGMLAGDERYMPARDIQGDRVNFGDNDRAADFFRADRALMSMGRASGGRADLMQMAREALNMQMSRRHSEEAMKAMLRPQPAQRAEGGRAEGRGSGNDKVLEHAMAILRHLITGGSR